MKGYLSKEQVIKMCDAGYPTMVYKSGVHYSANPMSSPMHYTTSYPERNEDALISAHDAVDWLREVKGLHIYIVAAYNSSDEQHWHFYLHNLNTKMVDQISARHQGHTTHEAALSAGIDHALSILEKQAT